MCGLIQERALFHRGTRFRVEDRTAGEHGRDYDYPHGLVSYVEELDYQWIDPPRDAPIWRMTGAASGDRAEVVLFDRRFGPPVVQSFVNGRRSVGDGSHVDGFVRAVTEVADRMGEEWPVYRGDGEVPLHGMTALVAVWVEAEDWAGSVKAELLHPGVGALVYGMTMGQLPGLILGR
jgi:DNA gyrase/topoisomerase IV subunit B